MMSHENDQEYEEEVVEDIEDPRPTSSSYRSSNRSNRSMTGSSYRDSDRSMPGSTKQAAFSGSSLQQSSVAASRETSMPQYNSRRRSASPISASNQVRSSVQQMTAPPSQAELIARSLQQNRNPSQSMASGREASSRDQEAALVRARSKQQNASSTQYMANREASMGSVAQHPPVPQSMASRQAGTGTVGQPLGAVRSLTNRPSQVARSPAYGSNPKNVADSESSKMRHWVIIFGLLILICLAAAAIVVPLYVKPQYTIPPPSPQPLTAAPVPTPVTASLTPTAQSISAQSMQPTTGEFAAFVKKFTLLIPEPTALEDDPTSPQNKAIEFIANDANFTSTITSDAEMGDFYALAVFYYSMGGDYWTKCSQGSEICPDGVSWMTYNISYCDWSWILCNEAGRVRDIIFSDVYGNNLTGSLPSELFLLTELEKFAVVNNNIKGKLPDKLGDLTQVTHFILSNNSLSGRIKDDFLVNSPLEVFMISDNGFNGKIPQSLIKATTLYQLFLNNNRFSGSIPEGFGLLPDLSTLDITGNRLSGPIPDEIYSESIQNLYLGGSTGIQGNLSSAVGLATNLVRLHITGTRISDGIPDEIFELPLLTEVVLSNNTLTGELSDAVANLGGTLQILMLDGNKFSGDLPNVAIDDLTISNTLTFDRNSFTGAISPSTCRRKGSGRNDLQTITVDCNEVTCSCCNNCLER